MSFFDDLSDKVSDTWNDVVDTGVPAVVAGVEKYASDQLASQAKNSQAQAQAAANQIAAKPGNSTGVMGSINTVFKNIATDAGLKQYGLFIVLGVVVIAVVAKKVL